MRRECKSYAIHLKPATPTMSPATRIFTNTFVSYGRTIVSVLFGMFSVRWVLAALGNDDYGLYAVVGSLIVFLSFFNSILSISVARFYAYSLGHEENSQNQGTMPQCVNEDLRGWFNTALALHICVPLLLVIVGYPLGEYAVRHWINIPPVRIAACVWVFRIAVLSAFVNMASVPFQAMFTARQLIAELSAVSMVGTVLNFVAAFFLVYAPIDRLVFYALCMATITAGIPVILDVWAVCRFRECRLKFQDWFDFPRLKALLGFSGATTFGFGGYVFASQGNVLLTNHFFGAAVNSAYGIAGQLAVHTQSLARSLVDAMSPAITTLAGRGDVDGTIRLSYRSGKLGSFLLLMFAIPVALELPEVLQVWLKNPPEFVVPVCRVILCGLVVSQLTIGHQMAMNANGKIFKWQMVEGCALASAVLFACVFAKAGMGPIAAACGYLVALLLSAVGVVTFCRRTLGMAVGPWLKKVVFPIGVTAAVGLGCGSLVVVGLPPSLMRVALTTVVVLLVLGVLGWTRVLDDEEKLFIVRKLLPTT